MSISIISLGFLLFHTPVKSLSLIDQPCKSPNNLKHGHVGIRVMSKDYETKCLAITVWSYLKNVYQYQLNILVSYMRLTE
jgi:hypothetical protein